MLAIDIGLTATGFKVLARSATASWQHNKP
jgi:hypothetical protein